MDAEQFSDEGAFSRRSSVSSRSSSGYLGRLAVHNTDSSTSFKHQDTLTLKQQSSHQLVQYSSSGTPNVMANEKDRNIVLGDPEEEDEEEWEEDSHYATANFGKRKYKSVESSEHLIWTSKSSLEPRQKSPVIHSVEEFPSLMTKSIAVAKEVPVTAVDKPKPAMSDIAELLTMQTDNSHQSTMAKQEVKKEVANQPGEISDQSESIIVIENLGLDTDREALVELVNMYGDVLAFKIETSWNGKTLTAMLQ